MPSSTVTTADAANAEPDSLVSLLLETGQRVEVPRSLLHRDDSGAWSLRVQAAPAIRRQNLAEPLPHVADAADRNVAHVIPLVEEQLRVHTQPVVGETVRVATHVTERQEAVELPMVMQTVDVERVAINREIDAAPVPRQEGDTYIVPVVEEIYSLRKTLMLREEVRLTTRRITTIDRHSVTLRRTEATVDRRPSDPSDPSMSGSPENPHSSSKVASVL